MRKTKYEKLVDYIDKTDRGIYNYYKKGDYFCFRICPDVMLVTDFKERSFCYSSLNIKNKVKIQIADYLLKKVVANTSNIKPIDIDKRNRYKIFISEKIKTSEFPLLNDSNELMDSHNDRIKKEYELIKNRQRNIKL